MKDVVTTLVTLVAGVGGFVLALLILYRLSLLLPAKFGREGMQLGIFMGPALAVVLIGLIIPTIRTVYQSFYSDDGSKMVGFSNYTYILGSSDQRTAIWNTLLWVLFGGTTSTFLGLTIARLADGIKGEKIIKALIFIPVGLSLAGAGIIWKFVYDGPPTPGLLNSITKALHFPQKFGGDGERIWILESFLKQNTFLLIIILIWVQTGFATVVLSAALKGVPESLQEAATVDGASKREVFYKITLPYMRPAVLTVLTTTTLASLKSLDIVLAAGAGGRFKNSVVAAEWYDFISNQERFGVGGALAIMFFILGVPVVIMNRRGQKRSEQIL